MKKIRIGNDIVIRATVTRQGEAEEFSGKTLRLYLRSAFEERELTFTQTDNVLTALWLGSEQEKTGTYKLTLVEDYGEGSRNTVDECDAFALVSCSHQECGLDGETIDATLNIPAAGSGVTTDIDLDISAPANGMSAYEIAVKNGYEGTETEWLASLSAEAVAVATAAAEKANAAAEAANVATAAAEEATAAAEAALANMENYATIKYVNDTVNMAHDVNEDTGTLILNEIK